MQRVRLNALLNMERDNKHIMIIFERKTLTRMYMQLPEQHAVPYLRVLQSFISFTYTRPYHDYIVHLDDSEAIEKQKLLEEYMKEALFQYEDMLTSKAICNSIRNELAVLAK